ncbi:hypothetical protein [Streptomyces sp. NPDC052042]|uniref:hypothetical protein n=1 Tax=Streptomyces sp. NPDC052042 TaxID=3365683 RepID=UPI0037CDD321
MSAVPPVAGFGAAAEPGFAPHGLRIARQGRRRAAGSPLGSQGPQCRELSAEFGAAGSGKAIQEICDAEDCTHAEKAIDAAARAYGARTGVEITAFWRCIKQGWNAPCLPGAHRQNRVVLQVLVSAAFDHADDGCQAI